MRFRSPLDDILRGRSALRVIGTLLRHPAKGFTGRELARTADVHPSDALTTLRRLESHGLVHRRTVGRAHEWRLQRTHFLVEPLSALLAAQDGGIRRLRDLVRDHVGSDRRVVEATLFGSVARGEETPSSDIDLLIVVRTDDDKAGVRDAVASLRKAIEATFTNPLAEVIYSEDEFDSKRDLALVRAIEKDGVAMLAADG